MTAVIGFVVQCGICPQQAVVATQPEQGWVCPRCAEVAGGFGDVDVAQAETVSERISRVMLEPFRAGLLRGREYPDDGSQTVTPVTVPADDPFALALMNTDPNQSVAAMVGDETFILRSWTRRNGRCDHEASAFETRWMPADTGCGHRSCARQGAGVCLGVQGAQMDYIEQQKWADDDDGYPITKVQG